MRDTPESSAVAAVSSWTWAHSASWSCGGSSSARTSIAGHCAPGSVASRDASPRTTISATHGVGAPPSGDISHGSDGVVNSIAGNRFGGMLRDPGAGSRRRTCWMAMPVMSPGP